MNGAESGGVPAIVTSQLASEVLRGVARQGAQPLHPLGAIPLGQAVGLGGALAAGGREHGKPGREGEDVVGGGVCQVAGQVGHGASLGHQGLDVEPQHGHHCKAPILDLLDLQLRQGVGVVGQPKGIERATWVQAVQVGAEVAHAPAGPVCLSGTHDHQLGDEDQDDGLGVHQVGIAQVVQPIRPKDGGTGLEPHSALSERHPVVGEDLWGQDQGNLENPGKIVYGVWDLGTVGGNVIKLWVVSPIS